MVMLIYDFITMCTISAILVIFVTLLLVWCAYNPYRDVF